MSGQSTSLELLVEDSVAVSGTEKWPARLAAAGHSSFFRRSSRPGPLFRGEAVEQAGAAGAHQVRLAAALGRVRAVPRRRVLPAALPIVMTELRAAGAVARPVVAGVIGAVRERGAIELRSGQHVVRVRRIATAVHDRALLGQLRVLGQ